MPIAHRLERIVVVPRNGYVNRLQAWASAAILAAELDVPLEVLWEPEEVAPATAGDLFDITRATPTFVTTEIVTQRLGMPHTSLPRYLTADPDRELLVLAGHDRGEQAFMPALIDGLRADRAPRTLLIIAGGKFHLPDAPAFTRQRQLFYELLPWHPVIVERSRALLDNHDRYIALHIRQTDRSLPAPTTRAVIRAVEQLRDRSGVTSLFVAADTRSALDEWVDRALELDLAPWSASTTQFDRGQVEAGRQAIVDWILLGHAQASVYSAASSFAEEAAVASGHVEDSIALAASATRQAVRQWHRLGRAAVNRLSRVARLDSSPSA